MRRALELAALGEAHASPNPMVGAVIVAPDGRIIGEGWHRRCGGPHAEVNAVASVANPDELRRPRCTSLSNRARTGGARLRAPSSSSTSRYRAWWWRLRTPSPPSAAAASPCCARPAWRCARACSPRRAVGSTPASSRPTPSSAPSWCSNGHRAPTASWTAAARAPKRKPRGCRRLSRGC